MFTNQRCCGTFNIEVNSYRPYRFDKKCHWLRTNFTYCLTPNAQFCYFDGEQQHSLLVFPPLHSFTLISAKSEESAVRPALNRRVAALSAKVAEVRITPRSALRSNPAPSPCYLLKVTPLDERQNADVPLVDTCYCNKCCSWHHCLDFSFDRQ